MLMEYVLTAAEMKACDGAAIAEYGIPSLVLMERAALQTAQVIVDRYGSDVYVGVMAGSGNNGGDGIAVARILQERGIRAEINLVGGSAKLSAETAAQLETAKKLKIPIHYGVEHTLYDVIVDAIFGIGLSRDVEGDYRKAVEAVNASHAKVVAVDIPSGVNTDDGSIMGCAVKADVTVTFAYRKLGLMLYPGASCAGEVVCAPIGIPRAVTDRKRTGVVTFTDRKKDLNFPSRSPSGNKGTFGKVLLIAGSRSMGGACLLSALSAYRTGAGMVRVFTASQNREGLLKKLPEAIVDVYRDETDDGETGISQAEAAVLINGMAWADVVAVGPGLSMSGKAKSLLELVLEHCDRPLVVDADALNILAQNPKLLRQFACGHRRNDSDVIFTPHLGEFSRLLQCPVAQLKKDIIGSCKAFTKMYDVSLVCKDARTLVAKRGKLTYLNASGNDGMATAGSGDVLTGVIAGLLAQGCSGFEAAVMGTYAHGLAGDAARAETSAYYIMAQDIIKALGEIQREQSGEGVYETL
ncbi:MAG: NAD(P)H-hydrate dehydratase [Lachnospiraceae bacterium]|nr:NAD(P)H-hydrate dehydratase [Lachnospiraceae bacterium]